MAVIAVTSGTSRAGKTTVAINLAAALGHLDRQVVLVDATPGRSTIAQRLGLPQQPDPAFGPRGVRVVARHGWLSGRRTSKSNVNEFISFIRALDTETDYVIVDTATSARVSGVVSVADDVAVVSAPERRATVGALALIRRLSDVQTRARVGLVVNGVSEPREGEQTYRVVSEAARFLDRHIEAYGAVTADPDVARAQMMQRAVVDCRPQASASRCFDALARCIANRGPFGGGGLSRYPVSPWERALMPDDRQAEARECA